MHFSFFLTGKAAIHIVQQIFPPPDLNAKFVWIWTRAVLLDWKYKVATTHHLQKHMLELHILKSNKSYYMRQKSRSKLKVNKKRHYPTKSVYDSILFVWKFKNSHLLWLNLFFSLVCSIIYLFTIILTRKAIFTSNHNTRSNFSECLIW